MWLIILILFVGIPTLGQSAFDGTWRLDAKGEQSFKGTEKYLLKNGMYNCDTCDPKIKGFKPMVSLMQHLAHLITTA